MSATPSSSDSPIPFKEAVRVWTLVALQSFGGPAGQIAVMHRILVEEKRWVSEGRFLHALNYCMLLPGPEAQQLAIYIGWLLHRTRGGLVAGILFVVPGFLAILALSILYAGYQNTAFVTALFFGLKPAVMAVVVEAVFRIGRRAVKTNFLGGMAGAAFIAIFFLDVPFPVIVAAAGLVGWIGGRLLPEQFPSAPSHAPAGSQEPGDMPVVDAMVHQVQPSWGRALRVLAVGLTLWFVPLLVLAAVFGRDHVLVQQGLFFSKAAVVTFGGAYAVLAYVGQQAVATYGWLRPGEMLDGLGMAETTPGPLIMVLQFVGFMGSYRLAGFDPLLAGILGSIVTTWVTFVPCFLWIFLGAPYVELLRGNRALSTALTGITAAVVGVILNLAVWFSLHTLFAKVDEIRRFGVRLQVPEWSTLNPAALVIAGFAFLALFRWKIGMLKTLAVSAAMGLVWVLATGL
ncbi:MAG TPA: chromate efflux transporter [Thermoanaerobaculia bacterium]|nr:chromate efflux transporter [Thermoanaerobaculia bacterium]